MQVDTLSVSYNYKFIIMLNIYIWPMHSAYMQKLFVLNVCPEKIANSRHPLYISHKALTFELECDV